LPANNKQLCKIPIGDIVIGVHCPSAQFASSMQEYFGIKPILDKPHINIKLNVIPHDDKPKLPYSLFKNKIVHKKRFSIDSNLVSGWFFPEKRCGEINIKRVLTSNGGAQVFEQLLFQAFYSARNILNYDAFLIHSSGVIKDNAGFLFVGASGRGKTTIARLSRELCVINDEINLISFRGEKIYIHGTPFNGLFKDKAPGKAPLRAIFFITHGLEHSINGISKTEAIASIAGEIVPPMGLENTFTKEISITMLDMAERLCNNIPLKKLKFLPDPGFWKEILDEFPSLKGEYY
jgi:hypothetical protein